MDADRKAASAMLMQQELWNKRWQNMWRGEATNCLAVCFWAQRIRPRAKGVILDLGAGDGPDTLWFAQQGLSVLAADFSSAALSRLEERCEHHGVSHLVRTLHSSISELALPEKSVDYVYSHLGIHFFDNNDTNRIFGNIEKWLQPNGSLGLKVKSTADPMYGKGDELDENVFLLDGQLRRLFAASEIEKLLGGFEIHILEEYLGPYPGYAFDQGLIDVMATKRS